jgi:hypothetical protein
MLKIPPEAGERGLGGEVKGGDDQKEKSSFQMDMDVESKIVQG